MTLRCVAALLLFSTAFARAADSTATVTLPEDPGARKILATGMTGAIVAGILTDSYFAWWKNAEKPFTFYSSEWFHDFQGIDRFGHMFTSYFFFNTFRDIMLWGGYDTTTARWWAAGLSAFEALSIEIGDGVSPYGFDPKDLTFNLTGIGYGLLQEQVPFLRNFNLKFSYWSARGLKSPANFTTDYDAMTIWMAINVPALLPREMQDWWPSFLGVAVGVSVDDNASRGELAIAFDINLESFDFHNSDVRLAQRIVNRMHLPMPGVKFTEGRPPTYRVFALR